jgi:hypothetical protein
MADEGDMETKEGMSELIASSQFDFNFSYGGNTISAEEMLVRALHLCPEIRLISGVLCMKLFFSEKYTTDDSSARGIIHIDRTDSIGKGRMHWKLSRQERHEGMIIVFMRF